MAERIERDAIADFEIRDSCADFNDFARGFMTENHREPRDHPLRAEFPIDDMQIGAAYAARADANEQSGFGRGRHRSFDQFGAGSGTSFCDRFDLRNL
jgi:hypothetical protein